MCAHKSRNTMWKLIQIFLLLQNCLILQVSSKAVPQPIGGNNGLLRSSINGVFYPVNYTSIGIGGNNEGVVQVVNTTEKEQEEKDEEEEMKKAYPDLLPYLEEESELNEDTNKTKRSRYFKRLLQKFGLLKPQSTEKPREFEAQMEEESGDADSSSSDSSTVKPRPGILTRLNPIRKIQAKISKARNALRAVGVGGKMNAAGGSMEGEQNDSPDSVTREGEAGGGGGGEGESTDGGGAALLGDFKTLASLIVLMLGHILFL